MTMERTGKCIFSHFSNSYSSSLLKCYWKKSCLESKEGVGVLNLLKRAW